MSPCSRTARNTARLPAASRPSDGELLATKSPAGGGLIHNKEREGARSGLPEEEQR